MNDFISIKGAKENNLKNISLDIPKNKLVVLTGVSGSGKSTIAFDTLQTECQRQYMVSLGIVTDEFVKPKMEAITGLSPAISVTQSNSNRNPRSTVGTITEIYTYLRILYAKLGVRKCSHCQEMIYPDFETSDCISEETLDSNIMLDEEDSGPEEYVKCPNCKKPISVLTMSHFSFNKPQGACETCKGLGVSNTPDFHKIFDYSKSIRDGGIYEWDAFYIGRYGESIENAAKYYGFEANLDLPLNQWKNEALTFLYYGALSKEFASLFPDKKPPKTVPEGRYEGLITNILRRYSESAAGTKAHNHLKQRFHEGICPTCNGRKLKEESAAVTVNGINIISACEMALAELKEFIATIEKDLSVDAKTIVEPIITDIKERLSLYLEVGIGYLSLDRTAITLSGGEIQRLRLASLLGSGLTGVLYVLDEPTTGLHSRDTKKLVKVLKGLRDMGNTVLVIEHDTEFMEEADYIIDIGPGAGTYGGMVVAAGTLEEIKKNAHSLTGKYLDKELLPYRSLGIRKPTNQQLRIQNACAHNLKNIDITIPLNKMVAISGVSGSGKSSLVFDVIANAANKGLGQKEVILDQTKVFGLENFDKLVTLDQSFVGKSSRSNVATYTDVYTEIRNLYAALPTSKAYNLLPKHFSFNVAGGRCEKCEGNGKLIIPMHFMPDAKITCPSCKGKRFQKKILKVHYRGFTVSDLLDMTVDEAITIFKEERNIYNTLSLLSKVGLGYIKLGQETSTLSGGEAQRIKLAKELNNNQGRTLYLLDEPTTGLHPDDIVKLSKILDDIVAAGNSMLVIEHNLDMINMADYVIDFGPEGGAAGGQIIAQGTTENIKQSEISHTGRCLR